MRCAHLGVAIHRNQGARFGDHFKPLQRPNPAELRSGQRDYRADVHHALRCELALAQLRRYPALIEHAEVLQKTQRDLTGHLAHGSLPMLPAFNQQRALRAQRIAETAIVTQPLARRVAGIDEDVFGNADRSCQRQPLIGVTGQRNRRCRFQHRMQVKQMIHRVVERPQLAGTSQLTRVAQTVKCCHIPQAVEILIDTARIKWLCRIKRVIRIDIREHHGECAA